MGCYHSKPAERKGLFSQQEEFVWNNNKDTACHDPTTDTTEASDSHIPNLNVSDPTLPSPSPHSPPASRPSTTSLPSLDGLTSLSEVWSMPQQWDKFKQYLATISEGEDSEGQPLIMVRYATFLEMYARLDMEYRRGVSREMLVQLVTDMMEHEEQFLGRERCLKCIDTGMRREVLETVKNVKTGNEEAGPRVFIVIYPRVVDRLEEMLGNYQNMVMGQEVVNVKGKS
eukprot:GFUD01054922.1.p1 GENE.GFUD01054922.1~~GFUD01054922.1.p1  ORF type:complete len:228 (+),score=105.18 GFUD01054922.1:172-855(+)